MSHFFCIFAQNFECMTGNLQFRRYLWLLNTIYSEGKLTLGQINVLWRKSPFKDTQELEYSRKLLFRHRVAIAEIFGIYIECDMSDNTYYIANRKDITESRLQKWALNGFAVQGMLMESTALKSRLLFEEIPSGHRFLTPIMQAMQQGMILEMTYQGFNRAEPHSFRVHPYCLKVFRLRWYMVGFNEEYGELRVYSLDRVHAVTITDDTFTLPKDFDAEKYFSGYFGTIRNAGIEPEHIEIEVDSMTANYIRSLPLHASQKEEERTDKHSVFSYFIAPTFDFIQELRTQGETLKVLRPQWLADKFKEDALKVAALYS